MLQELRFHFALFCRHVYLISIFISLKKSLIVKSVQYCCFTLVYPQYRDWTSCWLRAQHTGHFVQPQVFAFCGRDIYSRRKPLFSSFGEHTAVCGSSVRQAVARPRHRQSVCIHNIHVAATCRPSVLGSATKMRPHVVEQSGQCARALNQATERCWMC